MKWAKYALIAVAPIILTIGIWMALSGNNSPLPDSYKFVDAVTGEVVEIRRNKLTSIPAPNARDGKLTLFPLDTDEEGRYVVGDRYREDLLLLSKTQKVAVDIKSFRVNVPDPAK